MSKDMMGDIKELYLKFGEEVIGYREFDPDVFWERYEFMQEEMLEIRMAFQNADYHGMLDGLVDLVVVAMGTAYVNGFNWEGAWNEVQRANMDKEAVVDTAVGDRHMQYDLFKPQGWKPPAFKVWEK